MKISRAIFLIIFILISGPPQPPKNRAQPPAMPSGYPHTIDSRHTAATIQWASRSQKRERRVRRWKIPGGVPVAPHSLSPSREFLLILNSVILCSTHSVGAARSGPPHASVLGVNSVPTPHWIKCAVCHLTADPGTHSCRSGDRRCKSEVKWFRGKVPYQKDLHDAVGFNPFFLN